MNQKLDLSNQHLLEQIANIFAQAYFVFDQQSGQFVYWNQAFATLFGVSDTEPEAVMTHIFSVIHPADSSFLVEQYHKTKDLVTQEDIEFRISQPGQAFQWICLNLTLLGTDKNQLLGGYAQDITKKKEYLQNILKFNSKKNSTLEILSHDLAAPFANIEGMVNLLLPEISATEGVAQELVQYIKDNAMKGSDLIRDLIDNEFMESAEVVLQKERVNITHEITVMMENYYSIGSSLLSKNFTVLLPQTPIYIYVDAMKFMQVLNNLISNAIKFTQDEGTIQMAVEDQEFTTLISVSDNGIGIPKELQPQLFDKFTSSRRVGIRGEKSVGLGMSIIKTIVELHHGKVWFESEEGAGTTFFIEVPKE